MTVNVYLSEEDIKTLSNGGVIRACSLGGIHDAMRIRIGTESAIREDNKKIDEGEIVIYENNKEVMKND